MKRNKKGFSLVELVVVLVIMSILAALCAPNISAYVQAAKIQNYQTALNQLVDEVQTGLPKTRYWNWQEVQTRAEELLRSDSSRTVTNVSDENNTKVYRISGASNDANVVYQLTLTYSNNSNTSQKVEISASCEGYSAVTAEKSCDVVLKTNFANNAQYPKTITAISTSNTSGWSHLDDRVNTKSYWETWGIDHPENDFTKDGTISGWWAPDTTIVNLTDYVSNSCKFVQFDLSYFLPYRQTQWWPANSYAFPLMYTLDGAGDGRQYAVTGYNDSQTWDNIYIYIGDDSNTDDINFIDADADGNKIYDSALMYDHGWVKYSDIFADGKGTFNTSGNPDYITAFQEKYDDTIVVNADGSFTNDTKIKYRVLLKNSSDAESSRGWLYVEGTNMGIATCVPEKTNFLAYSDNGKRVTDFSNRFEVDKQSWNTSIYMDISKCGYSVGDKLSITLRNVDVAALIQAAANQDYSVVSVGQNKSYDGYDGVKYGNIGADTFVYGRPEEGGNYWIEQVDASTAKIKMVMTYSRYPFLKFVFRSNLWTSGATSADVDVDMSIDYSENTNYEEYTETFKPVLTINGDNNYANITLDWSKCDYITASNIGNMHLLFNKDLSYQVYDKDYNPVGYNSIYGSNTFYLNQMVNYQQIVADGVVHLYCTGVNARDITYEILDAPAPPAAPAVTTTTPAVTTTLPPATAEPETTTTTVTIPTTTTTSATTSTTTTVTTTTATTTTTTPATTTTTVTTTTTASTTSTSLSTSTTTTASTVSTTSTTLTTSTTASSTETTVTTSTSSSGEGAQTTIVTDVAFERAIEIPRHRCVEQVIIQVQDSAAGTSAGSWGYAFTDEYGWNYQGQGAFETNDLTDGTFTVDCSNGAPKKYLKIWKNGDSELVSVTFVYKDVEFLDDELYIHYLQGDSGFNVLRIAGNVESGIPNWGNNAAYQANTDFNLYKFEQDYHSVSIYPKNSNYQDLTVENLQNALNDKMLPSVAGGDWSNQNDENYYHYEITYAQVTGGLHEIWIYNGIAYTANPLDLSNGSRLVKRYVRGQTIGDLLQLVRREKALQETATTTTVTTTEPAASTTTTTTTTEPVPIAASENGLNVGLDAESAAVCDIQFDTPLFDQTGACRFVITPKDGYTLTNAYAVRVGTVTLSKKSNYTVQTQQWFFWKSKGMTNYTIHVSGVVADSAG